MIFGLEVGGRTFSKGSSYCLSRVESVSLVWGSGIFATAYSASILVRQDEFFAIGDTDGVFVYSSYIGGYLRVVSREPVSLKIYIYSKSTLSIEDSFGFGVYSSDGVQFTTSRSMLLVKDFKPYSVDSSAFYNPPNTYSFKPKVVCLTNSPMSIFTGASSLNLFNAYSIKGNTLRTAVATETRTSGKGTFEGFKYDNRAPHCPYGVTR